MGKAMKIYVASSWWTPRHAEVVERLRREGYEVYDYREVCRAFAWCRGDDRIALADADIVVGVSPFGRAASLEIGRAAEAGKTTILYLPEISREAELMIKICDHICTTIEECSVVLREVGR